MKGKNKVQYTAPAMQVVELHAETAICYNSGLMITWFYDEDHFSPNGDWDRPGYGDAQEY